MLLELKRDKVNAVEDGLQDFIPICTQSSQTYALHAVLHQRYSR